MTPREWNHVLDRKVEWTIAYPAVQRAAQTHLARVEFPGIGTTDLVEELYPEAHAHGDGIFARRRLFEALSALADHELADWCHQEEPTRARFGKMIRRRRWHNAEPRPDTDAEEVHTPTPSPTGLLVMLEEIEANPDAFSRAALVGACARSRQALAEVMEGCG